MRKAPFISLLLPPPTAQTWDLVRKMPFNRYTNLHSVCWIIMIQFCTSLNSYLKKIFILQRLFQRDKAWQCYLKGRNIHLTCAGRPDNSFNSTRLVLTSDRLSSNKRRADGSIQTLTRHDPGSEPAKQTGELGKAESNSHDTPTRCKKSHFYESTRLHSHFQGSRILS